MTESPETDSLVPLPTPRPREIARNRQSRPTSGTETSRNPPKPAVSSHLWHRDHAKSSKPAVSSLSRHRDHSESPETDSLVPPSAPRPRGFPENRRSRPTFGTETAQSCRGRRRATMLLGRKPLGSANNVVEGESDVTPRQSGKVTLHLSVSKVCGWIEVPGLQLVAKCRACEWRIRARKAVCTFCRACEWRIRARKAVCNFWRARRWRIRAGN